MPAGGPLEPVGDGGPRWMAATWAARPGYRIRLTGQLVRPTPLTCANVNRSAPRAHTGHTGGEHGVHGVPRAVVRVRPEMRVRVQRLGRHRVPEPALHRLDRLAVPDEQAGEVVAQLVEPGARWHARRLDGWSPDLSGEGHPAQRTAGVVGEHQPVAVLGGEDPQVLGERLDDHREDADVAQEWAAAQPAVLGAVLDLTARVLAELPTVRPERLPRMADFARVLAAVDAVLGTDGFGTYLGSRDALAVDAVSADAVLTRSPRSSRRSSPEPRPSCSRSSRPTTRAGAGRRTGRPPGS